MEFADLFLLGNIGEIGLETFKIVELGGGQKVQEVEQFLQVVLQGGTRQQHFVVDGVAGQEPEELRRRIFQTMSFVHDEDFPSDRSETGRVNRDQFV